jgi:DNA-binding XRE family transcriptional regulator
MTGTLIVKPTGEEIKVHATTEHPTSSYGKAVWVDELNNAYLQVGSTHPLYDIVLDEPYRTRVRIGNELAQHRRDKGYSVRQLAELAGVSKSTVVNIEAGRFSPTIDVANKLLTALGAQLIIP